MKGCIHKGENLKYVNMQDKYKLQVWKSILLFDP